MKITKRQLKRIIKEEKARLISERNFADRLERAVISVLEDTLDLPGMDLNPEAAAQSVRNKVDRILDQAVEGLLQSADEDFNPDRPFLESARQPAGRHLLMEAAYMHDIFRQAATALEMKDSSKLEDLAREVDGLMMNEREKASFSMALNAMVEAAYELEEYDQLLSSL